MQKNNVIFTGSGEFAVKPLEFLLKKEINILAIITQPDKIGGRGKKLIPTPVKKFALDKNIKILQPNSINSPEIIDFIKKNRIKINVVVDYGQILKDEVINVPELYTINLHPSLLPKYRGTSPIQSVLLNDEKITGVSVIEVTSKIDAGDIFSQEKITISDEDDYFSLFEKLSSLGAELLYNTIIEILENKEKKIPQDDKLATYCKKIKKEDGLINWEETSREIFNKIRAFVKWPTCYSFHKGNLIKFYKAKILNKKYNSPPGTAIRLDKKNFGIVCGDKNLLKIEKLQLQGKKILNTSDFLNGYQIISGDIFTNAPR